MAHLVIRDEQELTAALERAEELLGCTTASDEERERAAVADAVETYRQSKRRAESRLVIRLRQEPPKSEPWGLSFCSLFITRAAVEGKLEHGLRRREQQIALLLVQHGCDGVLQPDPPRMNIVGQHAPPSIVEGNEDFAPIGIASGSDNEALLLQTREDASQ